MYMMAPGNWTTCQAAYLLVAIFYKWSLYFILLLLRILRAGSQGQVWKALPFKSSSSKSHVSGCQVASWWLRGKESACSTGDAGDSGLIPWFGRSLGGGHGNSLLCSCLENPTNRGAWWAKVHRVAQSRTWLKQHSMHTCMMLAVGFP